MKVTFTLKDLSDMFFTGTESGSIKGLDNMTDLEKFRYLDRQANGGDLRDNIKQKIGTGNQFRDKVELNQLLRKPDVKVSYTMSPRRGYKLATFEVA